MDQTPFDGRIANLVALHQRQRQALADLPARLDATTGTATSRNRLVSATVDGRGRLAELTFHTGGYRDLAPAELSKLIRDTVEEARETATGKVRDLVTPLAPPGLDPAEATQGRVLTGEGVDGLPPMPVEVQRFLRGEAPWGRPAPEDEEDL